MVADLRVCPQAQAARLGDQQAVQPGLLGLLLESHRDDHLAALPRAQPLALGRPLAGEVAGPAQAVRIRAVPLPPQPGGALAADHLPALLQVARAPGHQAEDVDAVPGDERIRVDLAGLQGQDLLAHLRQHHGHRHEAEVTAPARRGMMGGALLGQGLHGLARGQRRQHLARLRLGEAHDVLQVNFLVEAGLVEEGLDLLCHRLRRVLHRQVTQHLQQVPGLQLPGLAGDRRGAVQAAGTAFQQQQLLGDHGVQQRLAGCPVGRIQLAVGRAQQPRRHAVVVGHADLPRADPRHHRIPLLTILFAAPQQQNPKPPRNHPASPHRSVPNPA